MFNQYKDLNPKEILIIRSSSKLFPYVIDEIAQAFPGAQLSVLSNSDIPKPDGVAVLYRTEIDGSFSFKGLKAFKESVGKQNIDCALVLYNSRKGFGYLNVDSFAFAAGAKKILRVNIDKTVSELSPLSYIYKWLHRLIDCVWLGFNFVVTGIVFVVILLAMVLMEPVITLKKCRQ